MKVVVIDRYGTEEDKEMETAIWVKVWEQKMSTPVVPYDWNCM